MYIPSAFLVMGLTFTIHSWEKRIRYQSIISGLLVLVAGIAAYGTASRTIIWQDNLAFYQDTLRKSPDFIPAQNELAKALYACGKVQEATAILNSLQIPPNLINRQYGELSKASALANNNDFAGARVLLNKILEDPGRHEVLVLQWLLQIDKLQLLAKKTTPDELYPGSVKTLTRLIELTGDPFYSYRLGIVHMQAGEKQKALSAFTTVVRNAPPEAYYRIPADKLMKDLAK